MARRNPSKLYQFKGKAVFVYENGMFPDLQFVTVKMPDGELHTFHYESGEFYIRKGDVVDGVVDSKGLIVDALARAARKPSRKRRR